MSAQADVDRAMGWQEGASCRGQSAPLFFPPTHFERKQARLSRERRAKAICAQCEVLDDCRAFALRTEEPHGVWGGLTEAERKAVNISLAPRLSQFG